MAQPPYGGPAAAQPPYGGPAVTPAGYGVGARTRAVVLGQDAGGLPAEAGLTHADFRAGEPVGPEHIRPRFLAHPLAIDTPFCRQVAVRRTSGRHTVGRVAAAWRGWVRVEVEPGGLSKDVPEGEVYRLLGGLRLA